MARRDDPFSVLRSRRFLASAVAGVLIVGGLFSLITGVNPVRFIAGGFSSAEGADASGSSLAAKAAVSGERIEAAPGEGTPSGKKRASKKKNGLFRRLFGRFAALFARRGPEAAEADARGGDYEGGPGGGVGASGSAEGRDVRLYGGGAPGPGETAPVLDSRQFGVGPVGLGMPDNGGPIAAGAGLPVSGNGLDPADDSYFDPNEPIPQVKPVSAKAREAAGASVGAAEAGETAFEEGPEGAANGATDGTRFSGGPRGGQAPAIADGPADRSRQQAADDGWADKPGGANLKKHKVEIPTIGGGKGIRNAPSRTY